MANLITNKRRFYLTTVIVLTTAISSFSNQLDQPSAVDPLTNIFIVPLNTQQVRKDTNAEARVLGYINAHVQKHKLSKEASSKRYALTNTDDPNIDKLSISEYQEKEALKNKKLRDIIELCKQTEGTDAGLTSVLLLATFATHDRPKNHRPNMIPITNALETIRRDLPNTWQGKVAPLIQASLMKQTIINTGKRNSTSLLPVIEWLIQTMPSKDEDLDIEQPDIQAFRSVYPLQSSLKANFLRSLAYTQLQAGRLDDAKMTCEEIIQLYPEGLHEQWARQLIDQIVALRASNAAHMQTPLKFPPFLTQVSKRRF
jgi:hypothetical protein